HVRRLPAPRRPRGRSARPPSCPRHRPDRIRRLLARWRPRPQRVATDRRPLRAGLGAAMLSPAALSTLTTIFRSGREPHTALGAWAAVSGLGGAAGVLFGGLLTEGPGWRWVLFVNVPFAAVALVGAFVLLKRDRGSARPPQFDTLGAFLATGGMLLLVYSLVK